MSFLNNQKYLIWTNQAKKLSTYKISDNLNKEPFAPKPLRTTFMIKDLQLQKIKANNI